MGDQAYYATMHIQNKKKKKQVLELQKNCILRVVLTY